MSRLLLDTSVLLSGIVGRPTSPPERLLVGMREGAGELLACPTIIRELRTGLAKPYFRQRVRPEEADDTAEQRHQCLNAPRKSAHAPPLFNHPRTQKPPSLTGVPLLLL